MIGWGGGEAKSNDKANTAVLAFSQKGASALQLLAYRGEGVNSPFFMNSINREEWRVDPFALISIWLEV